MPLSTSQYGFIIDPMVPFTDASGTTIRNGYVRVFVAGSSTPVITYKNYDGATNEETIQLDNSGRTAYPVIVSKGNTYKVCVYDAEHSQESPILTIDKVVPAGANVEATNIVTGLDNVESPEAGWVKSTVSGTDAEVSLDATNVTSEVDTMVKATAASADYMMPLVHKTGSDPDKKITLGNIFKFVLNFIHSLTDTATEADLVSGNYFALDGSAGTKKLNSTTLLTKTAQNALAGNVAPAFDATRDNTNPYKAGESVVYEGKTYTFKVNHYGAWDAADVEQKPINSFVKNKINLFDKDAVVVGEYITALGIASTNSDYSRTDYVPVAGLSTVVGSYLFSGAFYDEDKEFISSFTDSSVNSDHIYDVPDAAVYARVCCENENVGYAQFGYGLSRNHYYAGKFFSIENLRLYAQQIFDNENILYADESNRVNLFDKNYIVLGYYLNNGILTANASYFTSFFIPVGARSEITLCKTHIVAAYDSEKTFISNVQPDGGDSRKTSCLAKLPIGTSFIRLCAPITNLDSVQVGGNIVWGSYTPYNSFSSEKFKPRYDLIIGAPKSLPTDNIFNLDDVIADRKLNSVGRYEVLDGYSSSGYIKVGLNQDYLTTSNVFVLCTYKSDFTFSRYFAFGGTIKLNNDEEYVKVCVRNIYLSAAKVEKNFGATPYTSYGSRLDADVLPISEKFKVTEVLVGANRYFKTINSALEVITDATQSNRYKIVVDEGTYEETITTKDWVDIIGRSRYKCIINYNSPDESQYLDQSTIFATSNTVLENLTITTTGTKYPVHCDGAYNKMYNLRIVNCTLQHNGFNGEIHSRTALGIGLRRSQHIELVNCRLKAYGDGIGGASIYCHNVNDTYDSFSDLRGLTIDGCILEGGYTGLLLESVDENQNQQNECIIKSLVVGESTTRKVYCNGTTDSWRIENFTDISITSEFET